MRSYLDFSYLWGFENIARLTTTPHICFERCSCSFNTCPLQSILCILLILKVLAWQKLSLWRVLGLLPCQPRLPAPDLFSQWHCHWFSLVSRSHNAEVFPPVPASSRCSLPCWSLLDALVHPSLQVLEDIRLSCWFWWDSSLAFNYFILIFETECALLDTDTKYRRQEEPSDSQIHQFWASFCWQVIMPMQAACNSSQAASSKAGWLRATLPCKQQQWWPGPVAGSRLETDAKWSSFPLLFIVQKKIWLFYSGPKLSISELTDCHIFS